LTITVIFRKTGGGLWNIGCDSNQISVPPLPIFLAIASHHYTRQNPRECHPYKDNPGNIVLTRILVSKIIDFALPLASIAPIPRSKASIF